MIVLDSFSIGRYLVTHDNRDKPRPNAREWLTSEVNRELQSRGLDADAIVSIQFSPCLHDDFAVVYFKCNVSNKGCGRCHECGAGLWPSGDGEYCPRCKSFKNYRSHSNRASGDLGPCPENNFRKVTHV